MSHESFEVGDTVRIVRLLVPGREVSGASSSPPQPHVGEEGDIVADVGDGVLLVEHLTADGQTVWMAEFLAAELDLVARMPAED